MKVVKFTLWSNAAYMKANDRERMEAYLCEYEGNCPMYEQGKCVCETLFLGSIVCPHARRISDYGLTKRANGFGKLASQWREKYTTTIQTQNKRLCECGDYIYLPYPHLKVYGYAAFDGLEKDHFVKKDKFDVSVVRRIITYRPQALMGGEIVSFQKVQVPLFIRHLSEEFPELAKEYLEKYPEDKEKFDSIIVDFVGRKAYLNTLKDGAVYIDCHKNKWVKQDGYLVCNEYCTWLAVGNKERICKQQIVGDEIVEIKANDDVTNDTVFVD